MVRVRVAYFVHDLTDPAVERRVRMLRAGGADVAVFGFRRNEGAVTSVAGAPAIDLGRTQDAKLLSRAGSVAGAILSSRNWSADLPGVDVILARNLEMLVVGRAARCRAPGARLCYELLDVHRLLVSRSPVGAFLRALEGAILSDVALTIISSAAFATSYFQAWSRPVGQVRLVENLALEFAPSGLATEGRRPPGPPWRIGWFGMIRCRRSLEILRALAVAGDGLVQVEIRGRPSLNEFDDFFGQVANTPNLSFGGPYAPAEIADLYGAVHFTWAIDFFEAGLNSAWLLPNRLYEGQLYGAVPIALKTVETGRWLAARGAGLLLNDAAAELLPALQALTPAAYLNLARRTSDIPRSDLVCTETDCAALVQALGGRVA